MADARGDLPEEGLSVYTRVRLSRSTARWIAILYVL